MAGTADAMWKLWSILFWHVLVIINHGQVKVVRWQVLPATHKTLVLSSTDIVSVRLTLILTCYKWREQTAHRVHNKLTRRNLNAKTVSHTLKLPFLYQTRAFEVFSICLVNIQWIHFNSESSSIGTFCCAETWVSRAVGSWFIGATLFQLWSW